MVDLRTYLYFKRSNQDDPKIPFKKKDEEKIQFKNFISINAQNNRPLLKYNKIIQASPYISQMF